jgi:predicted Co/Zn/Cd cation transporter (cation efflux family)
MEVAEYATLPPAVQHYHQGHSTEWFNAICYGFAVIIVAIVIKLEIRRQALRLASSMLELQLLALELETSE